MAEITREAVEEALDAARPDLKRHGGNVELVAVSPAGAVLLRLTGACSGCAKASVTLHEIIEKALKERLPEVTSVQAIM